MQGQRASDTFNNNNNNEKKEQQQQREEGTTTMAMSVTEKSVTCLLLPALT
jgi:hypothetical protein